MFLVKKQRFLRELNITLEEEKNYNIQNQIAD